MVAHPCATREALLYQSFNLRSFNHPRLVLHPHLPGNTLCVAQDDIAREIRAPLPGYMAMGEHGMAEHQQHAQSFGGGGGHMRGPENTLPMMMGRGPFGPLEMGGMCTVV